MLEAAWALAEIFIMSSGLVFFSWGFLRLFFAFPKERDSEFWPTTPGKVVSSEERRHYRVFGHILPPLYNYEPLIAYEYLVDGESHVTDRISFNPRYSKSREATIQVLRRYPIGAEVVVYYRSDKPGIGVLEPGADGRAVLVVLLFGLLAWIFGFWLYHNFADKVRQIAGVVGSMVAW
ncbi:MAG: DUF3592 domain-containing protein [Magnetococcales bacterium]|nr:DUF3592 domain-containing protein [Magnetococcales bacterium]